MRMNIYVTDEMKARMDAVGQAVNWSSVAQRAFDFELNHLEHVKEIKNMTDVVERLRASKERFSKLETESGRHCGVEWAKKYADYDELLRMSKIAKDNLCGSDDAQDYARCVYETTVGDFAGYDEMADFYDIEHESIDHLTVEYVAAFMEGAMDVWDEIKDEI